jgi:hypothetical protein
MPHHLIIELSPTSYRYLGWHNVVQVLALIQDRKGNISELDWIQQPAITRKYEYWLQRILPSEGFNHLDDETLQRSIIVAITR